MPSNRELLDNKALVYLSPEDSFPYVQLADDKDGLTFQKEALYADTFKLPGESGPEFSVDSVALNHFVNETQRMMDNGVKVPIPIEHTTDPEKNRGFLTGLKIGTRTDGRPNLILKMKFNDEQAVKTAKASDVSIYSPPKYTDGKGNTYVRPIKHVALTNYPVIPGLDGFTPIAASLVEPELEKEDMLMSLKDLAANIGLKLSDADSNDDSKLTDAIKLSFTALQEELDESKAELKKRPVKKDPVHVSKAQIAMLRENRELKLSRLCEKGKIVKVVEDALKNLFCESNELSLCLSEDFEDKFDGVVSALLDNEAVISFSESSGPQVHLPKGKDGKEINPMVEEAKKRKEAAAAK